MRTLLLSLPSALLLVACGADTVEVGSFTGIDNQTDAKMIVDDQDGADGQPNTLTVRCDATAHADIAALVDDDGVLQLTGDGDTLGCEVFVPARDVRVIVVRGNGDVESNATFTALELLDARGNGQIDLRAVHSATPSFVVSGNADVTIGDLQATDTSFDLAGNGTFQVAGAADHATLRVTGNASFLGADFVVTDLDAEVSGNGTVEITVLGNVNIEGDGAIRVF